MEIRVRETQETLKTPDVRGKEIKIANLIAQEYKQRLRETVIKQERANQWKPLNKAYKEHKIQTGLNPGIWIATHKLIDSIVVTREGKTIVIGIDKRKKNKGTPLTLIAKAMEYGTKSMPPRPLFRPTKTQLVREIPNLISRYEEEGLL